MSISRSLSHFGFAVVLAILAPYGFLQAAPPPVIALFTDYGWEDPYVAQLKGVILTINPTARIVDLTHTVPPFNVMEGAYLLDQSAAEFPAGTIFVAVVDPQSGAERDPILLQTKDNKYFVGPDNGLFTEIIDSEGFSKAWKLDKAEFYRSATSGVSSRGRDIYAAIAARLAGGTDPEKFGTPIKNLMMLPIKDPSFASGTLSVQVLHIDHYGNIVLNLRRDNEVAAKLKDGNLVKISIGKESYSGPLVKTYGDGEKGRYILLYGSNGLLQIAMNQGSAAKQLKVEPGTVIFLKP